MARNHHLPKLSSSSTAPSFSPPLLYRLLRWRGFLHCGRLIGYSTIKVTANYFANQLIGLRSSESRLSNVNVFWFLHPSVTVNWVYLWVVDKKQHFWRKEKIINSTMVSIVGLDQTQDARHPPVAGHDNSADHPAASVVVRPRVVPSQRLADPLAVGVAAAALVAAHALVVQHGVDVHGALLALEASLRGDRQDSGHQSVQSVILYVFCGGGESALF